METLLDKTIGLLHETHIPMVKIASDTEVGERWLYMLKDGQLGDPGVIKVERVHKYLSRRRKK